MSSTVSASPVTPAGSGASGSGSVTVTVTGAWSGGGSAQGPSSVTVTPLTGSSGSATKVQRQLPSTVADSASPRGVTVTGCEARPGPVPASAAANACTRNEASTSKSPSKASVTVTSDPDFRAAWPTDSPRMPETVTTPEGSGFAHSASESVTVSIAPSRSASVSGFEETSSVAAAFTAAVAGLVRLSALPASSVKEARTLSVRPTSAATGV